MSEYKLTNSPCIIRNRDGACIPTDPENAHYAEYLRWVLLGGVPEPADPEISVDAGTLRLEQYRLRSDPLFFKEQAGEVPVGTWAAERSAIRLELPDE